LVTEDFITYSATFVKAAEPTFISITLQLTQQVPMARTIPYVQKQNKKQKNKALMATMR
jgi:hypothetical protein